VTEGGSKQLFDQAVRDAGYLAMAGQIVDASLAAAAPVLGRRGPHPNSRAAQQREREGGDQGRAYSRGVEEKACDAPEIGMVNQA
jgi:hypothetical protein